MRLSASNESASFQPNIVALNLLMIYDLVHFDVKTSNTRDR